MSHDTEQSELDDASCDAVPCEAPLDADVCQKPQKPKGHRRRRFSLWFLAFLVFTTLLLGIGTLSITGRTIEVPTFVTHYVEEQINEKLEGLQVSVGGLVVMVDEKFVPRVTARNVGLIDGSGAEIARLNSLRAVLSREAMTEARLKPDVLRLSGAQIVVRRRADGTLAFDFSGGAGTAGSATEVLAAIDDVFSVEPLASIGRVEASDLTVTLEDARSGRIWQAVDAKLSLVNTDQSIDISLGFELFNGTEDLAGIDMAFSSTKGSLTSVISMTARDVPARDFALQSPALSFMSVLDAPLSASMRVEMGPDGSLVKTSGTLQVGAGRVVPDENTRALNFEGAKGYFQYDPKAEVLDFKEISIRSDILNLTGAGQILLDDFDGNWPNSYVGQLALSNVLFSPDNLFEAPLGFETGSLDMKLELDPFSVQVGQFHLGRGDMVLRGSGRAAVDAGEWKTAIDVSLPQMSQADLIAIWPEAMLPKTREWLDKNIYAADYKNVDISARTSSNQQQPIVALGWEFDNAEVRVIKNLPPVTQGHGYASLQGNTLDLVLDGGHVDAGSAGILDLAGSSLSIPKLNVKPAQLTLNLRSHSSIEGALELLSRKPFNVLKDASFGADVAAGEVDATSKIALSLKKNVQFEDVTFDVVGEMTNLYSEQLLPGQKMRAEKLSLRVDGKGLEISGPVQIDTANAVGTWRKEFGPDTKGQSSVAAKVTLDQGFMDSFNIGLPKGLVSGAGTGDIAIDLLRGHAPTFNLTSNLVGLKLNLPVVGWRKSTGKSGHLRVTGSAGDVPKIDSLSLEAGGLSAQGGRVALRQGGGLDRMSFTKVKLNGWLDSAVTLTGRGAGQTAAVSLRGGTVDLRRAPFGNGGSAGGSGAPIDANLDRLIVTDSLRLHGLSAKLTTRGGPAGQFSGLLNGLAGISGTLKPGKYGSTIHLNAPNAGKVVQAAGLLDKANGGDISIVLTPKEGIKRYSGTANIQNIRVQSAPELAELLSAVSVVGLLEQMSGGGGLMFSRAQAEFSLSPESIIVSQASAEGASLGLSMEGVYNLSAKNMDFEGVISPIYFINALGQIVSRKGEGLFGFNYTLQGNPSTPKIGVNPLSILTPGVLRDIFRRRPGQQKQTTQ